MSSTWIQRKTAKGWRVDSCHFGTKEDGERALWNLTKANPKMQFRISEVLGEMGEPSEARRAS